MHNVGIYECYKCFALPKFLRILKPSRIVVYFLKFYIEWWAMFFFLSIWLRCLCDELGSEQVKITKHIIVFCISYWQHRHCEVLKFDWRIGENVELKNYLHSNQKPLQTFGNEFSCFQVNGRATYNSQGCYLFCVQVPGSKIDASAFCSSNWNLHWNLEPEQSPNSKVDSNSSCLTGTELQKWKFMNLKKEPQKLIKLRVPSSQKSQPEPKQTETMYSKTYRKEQSNNGFYFKSFFFCKN